LETTSFIITFVLAALMLYLLVRLPWAILSNLKAGHRFRDGLAKALDDLRLSRMLRFLGIDQADYLHRNQALEIKEHMHRCDNCDAKDQCDEVLQTQSPPGKPTESLGFCANIDDLNKMRGDRDKDAGNQAAPS
jgi:hypothetical protein